MTKTVTSTQLKRNTGEILAYAIENKEEVIIQRYDVSKAVIVDYDAYQRMREAESELHLHRIREIAEAVRGEFDHGPQRSLPRTTRRAASLRKKTPTSTVRLSWMAHPRRLSRPRGEESVHAKPRTSRRADASGLGTHHSRLPAGAPGGQRGGAAL